MSLADAEVPAVKTAMAMKTTPKKVLANMVVVEEWIGVDLVGG